MKKKIFLSLAFTGLCAIALASCAKSGDNTQPGTSIVLTPSTEDNNEKPNNNEVPSNNETPKNNEVPSSGGNTNQNETPTIPTDNVDNNNNQNETPKEPEQVIEYGEDGEPITVYQAHKLDESASRNSSNPLTDVNINIDSITNNSAIVAATDETSGYKVGSGSKVTTGEVTVSRVSGGYEQAYVEYNEVTNASNYVVSIKGGDYADFTDLNTVNETYNNFVYNDFSGDKIRTDIFGLKAGTYRIRIIPVKDGSKSLSTPTECEIVVVNYDRSGYAHFNYSNGVGAYKDDGTLKANAKVLYVTDENKNTITLTQDGVTVTGIGNILNTVGQKCGEAGHENDCKKVSNGKEIYGLGNDNQGILGLLSKNDIPLVIRFVGCVSDSGLYKQGAFDASKASLINGLTEYNSNNYGGSEGDNGHMARMKSAKNITIEGVGENAVLDGWGIHFICEANPEYDRGSNYEVRNLTFMNTPEDALGMEGQQESAKGITGAVRHCWIHHNNFLKPQITNPAESDKSEGDGSCDFKRGRYYTLSYNYFEYCHKTNLIGSSDTSLQFDISVHHNYWYNCGSRITLTRQANVHFYNNYNYCDINDKSAALSYITSLRASCYVFSEANYFEGCKNVFQTKNGYAKCYQNSYVSCFGTLYGGGAQEVTNREDHITNTCKDGSIDLSNFDTDSTLFYYNSTEKKSDCYLTSSTIGRSDCILYAGSQYRTIANKCAGKTNPNSNKYVPQGTVNVPDSGVLEIAMASTKNTSTVQGVQYDNVNGYTSDTCKFKGQGITFKLSQSAICTISYTGNTTGIYEGQIIRADGKVMLSGSGSVNLSGGVIYYVTSTAMDKETNINRLAFEKYDDNEYIGRIKALYQTAYNEIGTVENTLESYNKIAKAISLYNSLPEADRAGLTDPNAKLTEFVNSYKTYAEGLINAIGTVTKESAAKINAANYAYKLLSAVSPSTILSNISTLNNAIKAFDAFAVDYCKDAIDAIGNDITLGSYQKIQNAIIEYNTITDENSENVGAADSITNYSKLVLAIETYKHLYNANEVNNKIIETNKEDLSSINATIKAYEALTSAEKGLITTPNKYKNILLANFDLNYKELPSIENVQVSDSALIEACLAAYNKLPNEQKELVSAKLANINALNAKIEELGPETVANLNVTNFYDGNFTITGATSTSGAISGKVSKGNTIVVTSKVAVKNITSYSITASTADKGSTTYKVYTSQDGETWTLLEDLKNTKNSSQELKGTKTVSSACFIKIEITSTKDVKNAKDASISKLVVNA